MRRPPRPLVLACTAALGAAACGGAPRTAPPPAQREVAGPASFAGSWVADDDLDWGYSLTVAPDGGYRLEIDRGKMGRCEQRGRLEPGATPRRYQLRYDKDACTPDTGAVTLTVEVTSFTGDALTLALSGNGQTVRRTYERDPDAPVPAGAR